MTNNQESRHIYNGINSIFSASLSKIKKEGPIGFISDVVPRNLRLLLQKSISHTVFNMINREDIKQRFEYQTYGKPAKVDIGYPEISIGNTDYILGYKDTYNFSEPFVAEVPDVNIVGSSGVPVQSDNNVILEFFFGRRNQLDRCFSGENVSQIILESRSDNGHEIELGCPLYLPPYGFNDWLTSAYSKLRGIQQVQSRYASTPKLILRDNPPYWVSQYLKFWGYDDDDLIYYTGEKLRIKNCIVPVGANMEDPTQKILYKIGTNDDHLRGIINPDFHDWFISNLLPKAKDAAPRDFIVEDLPSDIYISRQHPNHKKEFFNRRHVSNWNAVENLITKRGYRTYHLEDMEIWEQILRVHHADNIIAPSGAGLSNIVYTTDANIIELLGADRQSAMYYLLANCLNHTHGCIVCDQNEKKGLHVRMPELKEAMDAMDM